MSTIRYTSFPSTQPPPHFAKPIADAFTVSESFIATESGCGLISNEVLKIVRPNLINLGFDVEGSPGSQSKIHRPVYYGEFGNPTLNYQVDAYHPAWKCGIEIEAGRSLMGNAVYRDLIQAMIMTQIDHLIIAIPNSYKYKSSGRTTISRDYEKSCEIARALYGHDRVALPFGLTLLGY